MKIIFTKCCNCGLCIPYCPVNAIHVNSQRIEIDQQLCVECSVCKKSGICEVGALHQGSLKWPRLLRAQFSDPLVYHPVTKICGRGTAEVKTNDVSNRIGFEEVGIVIEVGRPSVSTDFHDIEMILIEICGSVTFVEQNPLTVLFDIDICRFKDNSILDERVLSAIIECKTNEKELLGILKKLKTVEDKINTVFSVGVIARYHDFKVPVYDMLLDSGFEPRSNGKINIGLGRPKK